MIDCDLYQFVVCIESCATSSTYTCNGIDCVLSVSQTCIYCLQKPFTAEEEKWDGVGQPPRMQWAQYDTDPGSFEKCSLLTAALTHLGLYLLMFLGFVNQLLYKPKVATERNREVSINATILSQPNILFITASTTKTNQHQENCESRALPTINIGNLWFQRDH